MLQNIKCVMMDLTHSCNSVKRIKTLKSFYSENYIYIYRRSLQSGIVLSDQKLSILPQYLKAAIILCNA